jgi:hypothetical protein
MPDEYGLCPTCGDPIDYCLGHSYYFCAWCEEDLAEDDDKAELGKPGERNVLAHAEPCAFEMMERGWSRA